MQTIRNLMNSPYNVVLADGSSTILPARGTLEGVSLSPLYLPLYRQIGYFEISEGNENPIDPLDHDGDGKKGGSLPASAADERLQALRDEYTGLTGKKPHHLWKEPRLLSEIEQAREG